MKEYLVTSHTPYIYCLHAGIQKAFSSNHLCLRSISFIFLAEDLSSGRTLRVVKQLDIKNNNVKQFVGAEWMLAHQLNYK